MKEISDLSSDKAIYSECDIYYIFLQSTYHRTDGKAYDQKELEYEPAIKYTYSNKQYKELTENTDNFGRYICDYFDKHFNGEFGCQFTKSSIRLSNKGRKKEYPVVEVGEYFGYAIQMSMMVWRPFHNDDYRV